MKFNLILREQEKGKNDKRYETHFFIVRNGNDWVSGKSMWVGINHRKPVEEEFFVHNAP